MVPDAGAPADPVSALNTESGRPRHGPKRPDSISTASLLRSRWHRRLMDCFGRRAATPALAEVGRKRPGGFPAEHSGKRTLAGESRSAALDNLGKVWVGRFWSTYQLSMCPILPPQVPGQLR